MIRLGALAAVVAVLFVRVLYGVEDLSDRIWKGPEWARPAVGGLLLGLFLLALPQMYGVGYPVLENGVAGRYAFGFLLILMVGKILATYHDGATGGRVAGHRRNHRQSGPGRGRGDGRLVELRPGTGRAHRAAQSSPRGSRTRGGPDVTTERISEAGSRVHVLRDFALIADGERGAVVGPDGDIVWMCAPAWHDDAVFATLIGGAGTYRIMPTDRYTWGGSYEDGTLIWRGRWITTGSIIECHDALALPADPHRAVILRQIRAQSGPARLRVELQVAHGFGRRSMRQLHRDDQGRWTARSGDLRIRWTGAADARPLDGTLVLDVTLEPGDTHDLVLEISDEPLLDPVSPEHLWQATRTAWSGHIPSLTGTAAPRDARLAAAVLHGLTSSSGGMVAAATMSLPERAHRQRSYDYRYAWIRDQCYSGLAAQVAGLDGLFDDAVQFVQERVLSDGPKLKPAYRVDGGAVPDEKSLHLPGYPGGDDIRGNWVNSQFQLDALGEVLRLLSAAAAQNRLDADGWSAIQTVVASIRERWQQPDAGIWELGPDWWTQSRLACVAGLRQAAGVAAPSDAGVFAGLADAILAETTRTCLHPDGYWQRSPTRPGVDASLVWPAVNGALPANDPRTQATLRAVERDLAVDGYAYRYAADDLPLGEAEGAFLLCGFMLSLAYDQQGDREAAMRWFERNRAACGSPGLFTEEYDVTQRQLRGNLPQAFVHATFLQVACDLG